MIAIPFYVVIPLLPALCRGFFIKAVILFLSGFGRFVYLPLFPGVKGKNKGTFLASPRKLLLSRGG